MTIELLNLLNELSIYEKQELVEHLNKEIFQACNNAVNNLKNINGYAFGMLHNAKYNHLNELTIQQIDKIYELSEDD